MHDDRMRQSNWREVQPTSPAFQAHRGHHPDEPSFAVDADAGPKVQVLVVETKECFVAIHPPHRECVARRGGYPGVLVVTEQD
jgi:hypothetical protein